MTDRERLLEILNVPIYPHENVDPLEAVADYLIDNGVTFSDSVDALIEAAANQRKRAQYAEDFVCRLCAESEWEEKDGITTMIKKCCNWFPECRKFKLRSRWISVTERLPDTFGTFIVAVQIPTRKRAYSDSADYDPFTKNWTPSLFWGKGMNVTHWMPLPEPPKDD